MNLDTLFAWLLLAQNQGGGAPPKSTAPSPYSMLLLPALLIFAFYMVVMRPQRKEQRQRQQLLEALKKNDRIVTVGGIYGVVTNVRREADEVTLKVDEASNTKLRVTFASIARVLTEESNDSKTTS